MSDDREPEVLPEGRPPRDPADTLRAALVVYALVNLAFGVPILLVPTGFFGAVGVDGETSARLGGWRWVGAILVAWAVSALLVVARPYGRAYFVTVGSLQMTAAAVAYTYSWWAGEGLGAPWFQALVSVVFAGTALVSWWGRIRARRVLSGDVGEAPG